MKGVLMMESNILSQITKKIKRIFRDDHIIDKEFKKRPEEDQNYLKKLKF